ncbi:hypothetical protein [Natrinema pellirubrum]|nr:hypothetical protein [Natrinema pellirubrum]
MESTPNSAHAPAEATMTDDAASSAADDERPVPDCPRCGRPVWLMTVSGPGPGIASPCGCPVPPDLQLEGTD